MSYQTIGQPEKGTKATAFVWAHGWGADHRTLMPLVQKVQTLTLATHYIIDFPGFGESPPPQYPWSVQDYADFCEEFLKSLPERHIIWVGHSFGCRVGMKLASRTPSRIQGLFLMAAPGLSQTQPFWKRVYKWSRIRLYKTLKWLVWSPKALEKLRMRFGSADYQNAQGVMREILVKVLSDTLEKDTPHIKCPTQLVYGALDTESPPAIGEQFHRLIPHSAFDKLPHLDHYTILTQGAHQVSLMLKESHRHMAEHKSMKEKESNNP